MRKAISVFLLIVVCGCGAIGVTSYTNYTRKLAQQQAGDPTNAALQQNAGVAVAEAIEQLPPPVTVVPEPTEITVVPTTTEPPVDLVAQARFLLGINPECDANAMQPEGTITIDKISLKRIFVLGDGGKAASQLLCGPTHNAGPLPSQAEGVLYLAAHRTTHGAPFKEISKLEAGDQITISLTDGTSAHYIVDTEESIAYDPAVMLEKYLAFQDSVPGHNGLMLSACDDGDAKRIVVFAHREG